MTNSASVKLDLEAYAINSGLAHYPEGRRSLCVLRYRLIGTRLQSDDVSVRCEVSVGAMQGV